MFKTLEYQYPYGLCQDTRMIDQYCVCIKTDFGYQQVSNWYFRLGNAKRKYNELLGKKR